MPGRLLCSITTNCMVLNIWLEAGPEVKEPRGWRDLSLLMAWTAAPDSCEAREGRVRGRDIFATSYI